ncbi:BLUF domain-containing protein [Pedobacter sp. KR3-3]|uniref:BLUF domain-containing protein n=1 Tax=Pedobacter albus TaxID=3113905 RepID=A0ABU7I445_9SPHI|nr:BLUF domain-containing protein [Pedobacter sp. KR3-3]MEE1944167.1 BLUF domain-containing protein [Pedobacter sp. KR3-3]
MYFYLLYFAVASKEFTEADFEELLEQARSRNAFLDITGKLLHCEGTFIQLLEGNKAAVKEVYESIVKDQRLIAIKTMATGHAEERYYSNWSMDFKEVSLAELNKLENCAHEDVAAYIKNASAVKLLKLLAKA